MLTRTQTKHQIINHVIGCDHNATDDDVNRATTLIMEARAAGLRITTRRICATIDRTKTL